MIPTGRGKARRKPVPALLVVGAGSRVRPAAAVGLAGRAVLVRSRGSLARHPGGLPDAPAGLHGYPGGLHAGRLPPGAAVLLSGLRRAVPPSGRRPGGAVGRRAGSTRGRDRRRGCGPAGGWSEPAHGTVPALRGEDRGAYWGSDGFRRCPPEAARDHPGLPGARASSSADADGTVVRCNRTARSLLEPSHEPRVGRPVYGIVARELCDFARETIADQFAAGVGRPSVQFSGGARGAGTRCGAVSFPWQAMARPDPASF